MEQEKGLTKENTKKLFKWEGKKEIVWILFIFAVLFIAWAYNSETKICKEIQKTDCYQRCSFDEAVRQMQLENPDYQFNCDYETKRCDVSGVGWGDTSLGIGGFNITFKEGDTNNSLKDTR